MMVWLAVLTLPSGSTFKAGVEALKAYDDNKQNPTCEWKRANGGNAGEVAKFKCACHKDCPRTLRVKKLISTGTVVIEEQADSVHSDEGATHDRRNATLSKAEKKEMKSAMKYGGTAKDVVVEMAGQAVQQGSAKKKPTGGLEGAC